MTSLEGDFRRMISNAKSFNEKRSPAFSDSEKVRKILSRYMEEHNPAYRSPNYQAYTTPVPSDWKEKLEEQKEAEDQDAEGDDDPDVVEETPPSGKRPRLVTHVGSSSATSNRRASSTPAVQDAEGAFQSFEGNTFQEAQEKILTELINLKEDQCVRSQNTFHSAADRLLGIQIQSLLPLLIFLHDLWWIITESLRILCPSKVYKNLCVGSKAGTNLLVSLS